MGCELPPELWAIVFAQLSNLYDRTQAEEQAVGRWRHYDEHYSRCRSQNLFFQLPLVCKRFRQAFKRHTDMPDSLYLHHVRQNSLAGFDAWAAAHAASLQLFALTDTEAKVAIHCLKTIARIAERLLCIHISVPKDVDSLHSGALRHLRTCAINGGSRKRPLHLQSLRLLEHLNTLTLTSATFSDLRLAPSLRTLTMMNCNCTFSGSCAFLSSLVYLEIRASVVEDFGQHGLFACSSLQKLILYECAVTGIDVGSYIHEDFHEYFQCLDRLEVMIGCGAITEGMMDYDWLFQLTTLTRLSLTVLGDDEIDLDSLSHLSQLCELKINGLYGEEDNPGLSLCMRWGCMQCLQCLDIAGLVCFDLGILGLLHVESLRELNFACETDNQDSASAFAILLYRLARLRPDIECSIDGNHDLLASHISFRSD